MPLRDLTWRSPLTLLLLAACLALLGLGLRTFLLPAVAAAYYGVPVTEPDALVFVRAYGARNIAIALLALGLVWLDLRAALVALLAAAALVATLDAAIMHGHSGWGGAAKHVAYIAGLSGLALAAAFARRGTRP